MRFGTILGGLTVALALSTAYATSDDVRKIDTSAFDLGPVAEERLENPMVITSADELYDALANEEAFALISQQIDFNTETLLYFTWTGSGEDTLTTRLGRTTPSGELTFVFEAGMTLELAPHHVMFAIPKETSWKVEITTPGAVR